METIFKYTKIKASPEKCYQSTNLNKVHSEIQIKIYHIICKENKKTCCKMGATFIT